MSYTVKQAQVGFDIIEKCSNTVIVLERDEDEVRNICRKLNLGSGFIGCTPEFFAKFKGIH